MLVVRKWDILNNWTLSNPEQVWEWLDTDQSGLLTYEEEIKWLDEHQKVWQTDLEEEVGRFKISGHYKRETG